MGEYANQLLRESALEKAVHLLSNETTANKDYAVQIADKFYKFLKDGTLPNA